MRLDDARRTHGAPGIFQLTVTCFVVDSYASVTENADTHSTWQWPTRPIPLRLRIDYVFHSKHFRTVDSAIIRREGSDHSLVVATLENVKQAALERR